MCWHYDVRATQDHQGDVYLAAQKSNEEKKPTLLPPRKRWENAIFVKGMINMEQ